MSRLTRDGTAEPVSRDQILRRERGQRNINFLPCSADHEQDGQPYPVDPYSCYILCDDHTYIHTYIHTSSYVIVQHEDKCLILFTQYRKKSLVGEDSERYVLCNRVNNADSRAKQWHNLWGEGCERPPSARIFSSTKHY